MIHHVFTILYLLLFTTSALSTPIQPTSLTKPHPNTIFHLHLPRTDTGDVQCNINDNSPSTDAVLTLARGLTGEFGDSKEVALQNSITNKCSYVTESDVKGPGAARIEICAAYKQTALKVDIGRDMMKLATKCSEERNGLVRTQGWVGYHNWGRFQAVPYS